MFAGAFSFVVGVWSVVVRHGEAGGFALGGESVEELSEVMKVGHNGTRLE